MPTETVSGYRFKPRDLNISARKPGISAFLRTRNGADFLAATIRSHLPHFDEIVAVHNQCTDATPDILDDLAREFGARVRVFHYSDRVQPLGSEGHAKTPGDHPESMVNYSNFALAQTRYQIAVKLDDDHLAIPAEVARITAGLRAQGGQGRLHCFSGLNIARDRAGRLGIPAFDPVSGGGDIGFFEVSDDTHFFHDRRFERFGRGGLRRHFVGYLYWHLKFLKANDGFGNYELADNPDSRFARKLEKFQKTRLLTLPEARSALRPGLGDRFGALFSEKSRMALQRNGEIAVRFPQDSVEQALDDSAPGWQQSIGQR